MQQIMNYYEKSNFDQQMFFKFFISAKDLVLIVIPNNYTFTMLFREYIADITRYMEDDNDEKDYSKVRGNYTKGQLIVCNRCKFHTYMN
jgi:hypothetical protein